MVESCYYRSPAFVFFVADLLIVKSVPPQSWITDSNSPFYLSYFLSKYLSSHRIGTPFNYLVCSKTRSFSPYTQSLHIFVLVWHCTHKLIQNDDKDSFNLSYIWFDRHSRVCRSMIGFVLDRSSSLLPKKNFFYLLPSWTHTGIGHFNIVYRKYIISIWIIFSF